MNNDGKLKTLTKVKDAARFRDQEIARSKRMYDELPAQIEQLRREAREVHREANRTLIAVIRGAQSDGVSVGEILEAIDRSHQFLFRLESTMRKWDQDEAEQHV